MLGGSGFGRRQGTLCHKVGGAGKRQFKYCIVKGFQSML